MKIYVTAENSGGADLIFGGGVTIPANNGGAVSFVVDTLEALPVKEINGLHLVIDEAALLTQSGGELRTVFNQGANEESGSFGNLDNVTILAEKL